MGRDQSTHEFHYYNFIVDMKVCGQTDLYTEATMSKPAVVAAIDFGTSNTKLAFGIETNDPNNPYNLATFTNWKCTPSVGLLYTAPSTILLDGTGAVIAYGHEAELRYISLKSAKKGAHLFKHFKMEKVR